MATTEFYIKHELYISAIGCDGEQIAFRYKSLYHAVLKRLIPSFQRISLLHALINRASNKQRDTHTKLL